MSSFFIQPNWNVRRIHITSVTNWFVLLAPPKYASIPPNQSGANMAKDNLGRRDRKIQLYRRCYLMACVFSCDARLFQKLQFDRLGVTNSQAFRLARRNTATWLVKIACPNSYNHTGLVGCCRARMWKVAARAQLLRIPVINCISHEKASLTLIYRVKCHNLNSF